MWYYMQIRSRDHRYEARIYTVRDINLYRRNLFETPAKRRLNGDGLTTSSWFLSRCCHRCFKNVYSRLMRRVIWNSAPEFSMKEAIELPDTLSRYQHYHVVGDFLLTAEILRLIKPGNKVRYRGKRRVTLKSKRVPRYIIRCSPSINTAYGELRFR